MSELCLSSNFKTPKFLCRRLLLSDLMLFFSFIQSHPLYVPYFIFFLPYLLKLLSFLSPLFITTSLLLLGFLTLSPSLVRENSPLDLSESKAGFLLSTCHAVLERLRSSRAENEDEYFHHFEELEAYKMVFDTSSFYSRERSDEVSRLSSEESCFQAVEEPLRKPFSDPEYNGLTTLDSFFAGLEEKTVEIDWQENTKIIKEERRLEGLLKELDEFESMICDVEEKKVELPGIKSDKVEVKKELSLERRGSEAMGEKISEVTDNGRECTSKVEMSNSQSFQENVYSPESGGMSSKLLECPRTRSLDSNLGSYGSMRREKEWKRTLACKLFEERHNVSGDEGMDSLWETYEMDSSSKAKSESNGNKNKKKKKGVPEHFVDDEDVVEEEEEEDMDGKLCCLQALKFSAGKMNLGMGRPNLVKISKAIKGIGWLHNVTRHSKKGYN